MQRVIKGLLATLIVGLMGGPLPANAAAFLAINGGTWSYSAAFASSPAGSAYFWGLSVGAGSVSYAYAYSYSGLNRAAAFAIARAGVGWRGAWYAQGFADPQADIGLGLPDISPSLSSIVSNAPSGSALGTSLGNAVTTDETGASSDNTPGYTLDYDPGNGELDGITFNGPNDDGSQTNALDQLAVVVLNSNTNAEDDLCSAIGDTGCASDPGQTSQSGDITSLSQLFGDLAPSILADVVDPDPGNVLNGGTFSFPDVPGTNSGSPVIVVEDGTVPEPASMLLLGSGLLTLGIVRRRRRRG